MKPLLRVEFHCHSVYSKDSLNPIEKLIKTAHQKGLDRLILTDHNTIRGALKAQKLDSELIIVGEEIQTTKGELLASFVSREVPINLEPEEALKQLRDQGAFISVSHPFDIQRHGWHMRDLEMILDKVDAIEVFNSRCINPLLNKKAKELAIERKLAGTVGSDAHALFELGRSTLLLPYFNSADELRKVIRFGDEETQLSSPWVHFSSRWAKYYKQFFRRDLLSI